MLRENRIFLFSDSQKIFNISNYLGLRALLYNASSDARPPRAPRQRRFDDGEALAGRASPRVQCFSMQETTRVNARPARVMIFSQKNAGEALAGRASSWVLCFNMYDARRSTRCIKGP